MQRLCKTCGDFHDLEQAWPCPQPEAKSPAFYVISDTMPATKHMGTGRIHDSKARFRADTKASGCVELGNESIKPRAPIKLDSGKRREAIQKSIHQLRNGR